MSEDKPLPLFCSDDEAEAFVDAADLTSYDLSALTPMRFKSSSKDARVNMRLPTELLEAVKAAAARRGCPTSVSSGRPWSRGFTYKSWGEASRGGKTRQVCMPVLASTLRDGRLARRQRQRIMVEDAVFFDVMAEFDIDESGLFEVRDHVPLRNLTHLQHGAGAAMEYQNSRSGSSSRPPGCFPPRTRHYPP